MIETKDLYANLKKYFNHDNFKPGQKEIISDVLDGKDVLGILPTGSGKSICYQLPALMKEGTTIVVTPLISLMIDQVRELKAKQIRNVIALNSFMTWQERNDVYKHLSTYKIVYISPELLQHEHLQTTLKNIQVSLFVIDEAHCLSQWGHEFRTDYLRIKNTLKLLQEPPVLALTATATKEVQDDILNIIDRRKVKKHIYSIDRPNITFFIQSVESRVNKLQKLIDILKTYQLPTLIYFSSRVEAESTAEKVRKHLPHLATTFYHGGMDSMDRIAIQQQFMNDQLDIICCTSAFGMGINKKNIRLVIHYHFPGDIESYVQEVGRAGRDGLSSLGIILYSNDDIDIQNYIIQQRFPEQNRLQHIEKLLLQHSGGKFLPIQEKISLILNDDDVHLQFLQYHLEKHGIIENNKIIEQQSKITEAFQQISLHIKNRYQFKMNKLQKIVNLLQSNRCIRSSIYEYFKSTYERVEHCCSNCGFSLEEWQPKETILKRNISTENWKEKLSKLLLIEE